jgi:hypothetical protein
MPHDLSNLLLTVGEHLCEPPSTPHRQARRSSTNTEPIVTATIRRSLTPERPPILPVTEYPRREFRDRPEVDAVPGRVPIGEDLGEFPNVIQGTRSTRGSEATTMYQHLQRLDQIGSGRGTSCAPIAGAGNA